MGARPTDYFGDSPLIAPGAGSFRFADHRGETGRPLTVWYHRPPALSDTAPIVFVMHGVKRDADNYRDNWTTAAERFGFLLLCPEFSKADYPHRAAYQLGNLVDSTGGPLPKAAWTFNVIERLFDFVKEASGTASERYHIYGHSAGASSCIVWRCPCPRPATPRRSPRTRVGTPCRRSVAGSSPMA